MAIRCILVGLVASLGFDIPSGEDVVAWARSGRGWAEARLAEASHLRLEAARRLAEAVDCERANPAEPAPAVEVALGRDELTFDAVVDGMAKDFAADLASTGEVGPTLKTFGLVGPSREAFAPATSPDRREAPGAVAPAEARTDWPGRPTPAPTRAEKISTAVRLTRRAMDAWAALIEPSTGEPGGGEEDSY